MAHLFPFTKLLAILLLSLISTLGFAQNNLIKVNDYTAFLEQHDEAAGSNIAEISEHEGGQIEEHEGGHKTDTAPLLFIILAIIVGVATRHFVKRSPFPFTVLLLIIGLVLGVINRFGFLGEVHILDFTIAFTAISESINFAANMDPHMLLFIFLPILIFEASYAMDLHTFKKTSTNAI